VKDTRSTPGWATSAAPAPAPRPCTTFSTPGGSTSAARLANRAADRGVFSAGLSTTVFPVAMAGTTFQTACHSGKFHGVMAAATPTGSRRTKVVFASEYSPAAGAVDARPAPAK
jgi:hypothetical protein